MELCGIVWRSAVRLGGRRGLVGCGYMLPVCARHHVCPSTVLNTRTLHTSSPLQHILDARDKDHELKESKSIVKHTQQYFDNAEIKKRDKAAFQSALEKYLEHQAVQRRGHVEFIYASMNKMKEYGVHRDLETYKHILHLFPTSKMIPKGSWQVEMMHFPKQQQCCIDLLEMMENNGVIPDDDLGYALVRIFGDKAHAFRKYRRMMYWMPKFKYANPYRLPDELPEDPVELAKMALKRMAVDLENEISVFETRDLESSTDDTFIVGAQSPMQRELLSVIPQGQSVRVEGGFMTRLRSKALIYYVLKGETTQKYNDFANSKVQRKDSDDSMWNIFEEESPKMLSIPPSAHEQEDGTVLAMCISGTSSKDSLAAWIKFLEDKNPHLSSLPVVFLLKSPTEGLQNFVEEIEEGTRAITES